MDWIRFLTLKKNDRCYRRLSKREDELTKQVASLEAEEPHASLFDL